MTWSKFEVHGEIDSLYAAAYASIMRVVLLPDPPVWGLCTGGLEP